MREVQLQGVERREQSPDQHVVFRLRIGGSDLVNTTCNVVNDLRLQPVNLIAQVGRIQINRSIGTDLVKGRVQHAYDVERLVVDDPAGRFIPKHRNGYASRVVG